MALDDDDHVTEQRRVYHERLTTMAEVLSDWSDVEITLPDGGFYLWFRVGDAWAYAERLAAEGGALVSPGEFYGHQSADHVRVAVVQPTERLRLVATRLRGS